MLFNNEAQRLAHPQATLIPLSVWNNYFRASLASHVLADELISLMTINNYDDLLVQLQIQLQDKRPSLEDKKKYWLALAYSHADLDVSQLTELASSLGISNNQHLYLACALGHVNYFIYVAQQHVHELLNISLLCSIAAEHGHLEMLHFLVNKINPEHVHMIKANDYHAFRLAAKNGHLNVLQFLVVKIDPE